MPSALESIMQRATAGVDSLTGEKDNTGTGRKNYEARVIRACAMRELRSYYVIDIDRCDRDETGPMKG